MDNLTNMAKSQVFIPNFHKSCPPRTRLLSLGTIDFRGWIILCRVGGTVRYLSASLAFASNTPYLIVITKNVTRHCQCPLGSKTSLVENRCSKRPTSAQSRKFFRREKTKYWFWNELDKLIPAALVIRVSDLAISNCSWREFLKWPLATQFKTDKIQNSVRREEWDSLTELKCKSS